MTNATIKYSEIFHSFQGEGHYTGVPCTWIRFFKCNLQCDGFGQPDPTDPNTYILPYKELDLSNITRCEDLPVFDRGCDSGYTWSARYKHLMHNDTAAEICAKLEDVLKHETNPNGYFHHPKTHQDTHMCFTGGEPMLNQEAMASIITEFLHRGNLPHFVTVETNGTRPFKMTKTADYSLLEIIDQGFDGEYREWFWSVSPKLWSVSGEKPSKAIKPDVVATYADASNHGQLKYVVNGTRDSWLEVEQYTKQFRAEGVDWPVWIMPVGATKEQQEDKQIAEIAVEAMKRGYNVSGRLHCYVFGNQIGT